MEPQSKAETKRLDTAKSLAEFLNVSLAAVRKWTRLTDMPRVKIGRSVRFQRESVLEWTRRRGG
jgi:excisionase family DNA binding protein